VTLYQEKYRIESARLRGWDYRTRGWYFVTMCAQNRKCIFGQIVGSQVQLSRLGRIAESELQNVPCHYQNVQIDSFVVMPNHVHALIAIDGDYCFSSNTTHSSSADIAPSCFSPPRAGSLSAIVRSYKAGVTHRCRELGLRRDVWQPRFHDHLARGDGVISAIRDYICNNPANWAEDHENRP